MDLPTLLGVSDLPDEVTDAIAALVIAKRRTNERGNAARVPVLDYLIRDELARVGEVPARRPDAALQDRADALFVDLVNG